MGIDGGGDPLGETLEPSGSDGFSFEALGDVVLITILLAVQNAVLSTG